MPESPPITVPFRPLASLRRELIGLAIIFLTVVAVYAYIGIPPLYGVRFLKGDDGDYYNQLADGLAAGRLGFKKDPPPALVALKDPYDPAQRVAAGNVGAHDATYFKGRYYLYFGVAPALTLFLPFQLLTGIHFPQNLATVVFCATGYGCSLGLLFGLRRRAFPRAGTAWIWAAGILLGLGNFCAPMLARNSVWELPIAGAYFFSMAGFWLVLRGLDPGRGRGCWFGLASVAFGLAAASRPHFVFVGAGLTLLWAGWTRARWRRQPSGGPRVFLGEAAAILLPLGLIVAGLLLYNYRRFENPFEFGQKYQLAGNRQVDSKLVGFRFFPINFYLNFLAPAQLDRYFPFFQMIRGYPGPRPADYGGAEDPYGVFANLPATWLAVLALGLCARREPWQRKGWLAIFGGAFLVLGVTVSCFAWSANRYEVDFLPSLLLLAILGLLHFGAGNSRGLVRGVGAVAAAAMIASTVAFNLFVAVQHNDLFKAYRPETFARLAGWFNRPALAWERGHPPSYGPAELTVRFPRDQLGKAEPLAVTGLSYKSDFVYVLYYPNARQVRLAFNHTGGAQLLTPPIAVDFSAVHRIAITAGSFYPAASHPFFSGRPAAEVAAAKRTLRVDLDGVPYLASEVDFYDASPGFVTFGENHVSDYIGRKFTGELLQVRRGAVAPLVEPFTGEGFLQLALRLPRAAGARREPLVLTGEAGRRDLFFVDFPEARGDTVRFGLWHEGEEPVLSAPVTLPAGDLQVVEVSLGSFYRNPAGTREKELAQTLAVRVNGQTVWILPQAFHSAGTEPPVVGGSGGVAGYSSGFSGEIVAQHRVRPFATSPLSPFVLPPYWLETEKGGSSEGALRVHLELPAQRPTKAEPLVVTGASALLADYVTINYTTADRLILSYVHAGSGGPQSPRIPVDAAREQVVEVDMPSLYPAEGAEYFATRTLPEIAALRRNRARIKLNGRLLFDTQVPAFDSPPDRVDVGVDRLAQAFGPRFSGRIVAVERSTLQPPQGLQENAGPLELKLVFPLHPLSPAETLFATGGDGRRDALVVVYETPSRAHLELRTGENAVVLTGPAFSLDAVSHVLRLEWGGLYPGETPSASLEDRRRTVKVLLDGAVVLEGRHDFAWAIPQGVNFGNAGANDAFSGRLQAVRRLP